MYEQAIANALLVACACGLAWALVAFAITFRRTPVERNRARMLRRMARNAKRRAAMWEAR